MAGVESKPWLQMLDLGDEFREVAAVERVS
jgi:hypothetical protein